MHAHEIFEDIEMADLGSVKVPLYRNPSAPLVARLLQNWQRARGVEYDDTIWLWNSHEAVHAQVEDALLLPAQKSAEFMIQDGSPATVSLSYRADRLRQSERLRAMMADLPDWSFGRPLQGHAKSGWTPYSVRPGLFGPG